MILLGFGMSEFLCEIKMWFSESCPAILFMFGLIIQH